VLLYSKERIVEAALPDHVVQLYLDGKETRLIVRMKNIIKQALCSSQSSSVSSVSKPIHADTGSSAVLVHNQMKYAQKKTPTQRKQEAVQSKIRHSFVSLSSESESDSEVEEKGKRKRKSDHAKEAQQMHKKMCERAMETMDKVADLLNKVDKQIDKNT